MTYLINISIVVMLLAGVKIFYVFATRQKLNTNNNASANDFVVLVPNVYLLGAAIFAVVLWAIAAFLLYTAFVIWADNHIGFIVFSLIIAAIAAYFTYLSAYFALYETRVSEGMISHRELFHSRSSFTLYDVCRVKIKHRALRSTTMTVYSSSEKILVAEPYYKGYDKLLYYLKQAGIEMELK